MPKPLTDRPELQVVAAKRAPKCRETAGITTSPMQPTSEATHQALVKPLALAACGGFSDDKKPECMSTQIELCIECTKAEVSEGAALVDACSPHGRAMLTQAQKRLEAILMLEAMTRSSFGPL